MMRRWFLRNKHGDKRCYPPTCMNHAHPCRVIEIEREDSRIRMPESWCPIPDGVELELYEEYDDRTEK